MAKLPEDYVSVATRIEQAHKKHEHRFSIETDFEIKDQTVIFSAKVTALTPSGISQIFTGHSFGTVGREKSFEKLETVAVGRALAFAGFETTSGIASREEMDVFTENQSYSSMPGLKEGKNRPRTPGLDEVLADINISSSIEPLHEAFARGWKLDLSGNERLELRSKYEAIKLSFIP